MSAAAQPITFSVLIRTESRTNAHKHWRHRQRRAKREREETHKSWLAHLRAWKPALPCRITLVRVAPRLLDEDNVRGALKSIQDGIADCIGVDDRDKRVDYLHAQRKSEKGEPAAVEVTIEQLEAPERCPHCGGVL